MTLGHASQPIHVSIGSRIVNHQQIAIAHVIGLERSIGLAFSVPIAWVAVHTGTTHISRPQTTAHTVGIADKHFLEQLFTSFERQRHSGILHSRSWLFESRRRGNECRTQFSASVIPVRQLARCRFGFDFCSRLIIATSGETGQQQCCKQIIMLLHNNTLVSYNNDKKRTDTIQPVRSLFSTSAV